MGIGGRSAASSLAAPLVQLCMDHVTINFGLWCFFFFFFILFIYLSGIFVEAYGEEFDDIVLGLLERIIIALKFHFDSKSEFIVSSRLFGVMKI